VFTAKLRGLVSKLPIASLSIDGDANYPFPPGFSRADNTNRIPPILILPKVGVTLAFKAPSSTIPTWPNTLGSAGYMNTDTDMVGVFAGRGPNFLSGVYSDVFPSTVDVYSLLCFLMDIQPASGIDGSLSPFHSLLSK
jgi:hypothetical protein